MSDGSPEIARDVFGRERIVERFDGDEETARMIVGCFLSDFPRQIGFIRNCLPFGNWSEAAMLAHASRGAAGCVEAGKIATILLDLENALNGHRPEESEKMLLQLDEEFLRYREAAEISGMAEESRENPNEDTDS